MLRDGVYNVVRVGGKRNPFTLRHPLSGWYDVPTLKGYNSWTEPN